LSPPRTKPRDSNSRWMKIQRQVTSNRATAVCIARENRQG
jgi:hypothetical protein